MTYHVFPSSNSMYPDLGGAIIEVAIATSAEPAGRKVVGLSVADAFAPLHPREARELALRLIAEAEKISPIASESE